MSFSGKRADRMWHVLCYLFVSPDCSICYFRITTFLIWFLARGRTNNWDSHTKIWSNNKTTFVKINLAMLYTGGGDNSQKNWMGMWARFQNPYLFMAKICDFSSPIYDLTKVLIPCLWPLPNWHSCPKLSLWRVLLDSLIGNEEKVTSSKIPTQLKTRLQNQYAIYDQSGT